MDIKTGILGALNPAIGDPNSTLDRWGPLVALIGAVIIAVVLIIRDPANPLIQVIVVALLGSAGVYVHKNKPPVSPEPPVLP